MAGQENLSQEHLSHLARKSPAVDLITRVSLVDLKAGFHEKLTALMISCWNEPGFLNAEITPVEAEGRMQWIIIQRFRDEKEARQWCQSEKRRKVVDEVAQAGMTIEEEVAPHLVGGTAAISIASRVHPGKEPEYRQWLHKIQTEQAKFSGYTGTYLQPPTEGAPDLWMTLLRFDTPESLDRWLRSEKRLQLIDEAKDLIESENIQQMTGTFPGWFPDNPQTHEQPAPYKGALLVLLAIYPIVILQVRFFNPATASWPTAYAIFVSNIMSVSLLSWVFMPLLSKLFFNFLFPKPNVRRQTELQAIVILLVLYALEITASLYLF